MKQNNEKTSKGVALTEAQWDRCDRLANELGCRSRNAFIRDAIDFYCSWLEKEQSERFLTPALESVISAKIHDSEERINRNLFKIAVDLSILAKIVQGRTIIPRDRLLEWLDEQTRYDELPR